MFLDAWSIYGSCGLLELEDSGKQDFTVTESQYNDLIRDKDGVLTQFEISPYAPVEDSSYIINENRILVGKDGLAIINNSPATKIIFQSKSEDSIILLGDVSVYNHVAELIFIGPSIYCNGCKFPGIDKVVFSTTPTALYSLGIVPENNQTFYVSEYRSDSNIYIGSNGLLSSSISLYLFSDIIKAFGVVKVDSIILQADSNVNFDKKVWSNSLQAIVKNNLFFKELYIGGDVSVTASKWEISYKFSISGDCYFKGKDYLIPNTQGSYYVGGNLDLVLIQDRYQLDKVTAKGNITVTSDYAINISTLLSSQSIKIQSKTSISILINLKANLAIKLISYNDIIINGLVESSGIIELNSSNLQLHGKINAGKLVKIIAKDNINLDKSGAHLFSQGDLLIANLDSGPIASVYILASKIEIIGNAIIKTNYLRLSRDGSYKVINQDISQASQGAYHGSWKWGISMTCYQEILTGNLGTEAKLIVGGDLTFEGRKIDNELSKIAVAGKKNFINKEPETYNKMIDLRTIGNFKCNWAEEKYYSWCVGESRNRLANYCGLNTNGQTNGPLIQSYKTINSVTNFKYNNALSEIKQISIEAVEINSIEIEVTEQNHKQNNFIDQNLVTSVTKYKTHVNDNLFPEVRSNEGIAASLFLKNGICKLRIKNDTNTTALHIARLENQDINRLKETLLARDEYGISPLHWAIDDDVERVQYLLNVGNKLLYEMLSDKEGSDQNTPLHAAIFRSTQIQQIIYLKILSEHRLLPLLAIDNRYQFSPLNNLVLLPEIEFWQLIEQARKFDTLNALLALRNEQERNILDLAHYEEKIEMVRIISSLMNGALPHQNSNYCIAVASH